MIWNKQEKETYYSGFLKIVYIRVISRLHFVVRKVPEDKSISGSSVLISW